jgi:uncharacterized membrane protein YbhN (UPF0104 family)
MVSRFLRRAWPKLRPWLPLLIGAALLYFLVAAVQPARLGQAARQFNPVYVIPLVLTYLGYLGLRAARWHLLMQPLGVPNSLVDSMLLFAGAQAALLIPAGQFLLPVLQKTQHGTLIRRCAATVIVQELIFGVLVLPAALPGVWHDTLAWLLAVAFLVSIGAGVVLLVEPIAERAIGLLGRLPFVRNAHLAGFRDLRQTIAHVASTQEALIGSVLDMGAVALAGTSLYIALVSLGVEVGWPAALASFAFGNAAANVTSLPGGLGATEDTATAVLTHIGVGAGPAAAGTLIYRAATLILGTLLGWAVLLMFRRRFNMHRLSVAGVVEALQRGAGEASHGGEPRDPARDPATQPVFNPGRGA